MFIRPHPSPSQKGYSASDQLYCPGQGREVLDAGRQAGDGEAAAGRVDTGGEQDHYHPQSDNDHNNDNDNDNDAGQCEDEATVEALLTALSHENFTDIKLRVEELINVV